MPKDVDLRLATSGTPITATGNGAAVDTEGGFRADVEVEIPALATGTTPSDSVVIQASRDGGTNYFPICNFPAILGADIATEITTNGKSSYRLTRPCYVPRPNAGVLTTKVRAAHTVAGTTPSIPENIFVLPIVSVAVDALDEMQQMGLAKLV